MSMADKTELEQEIEWLREEISDDESLIGTSDFSGFHAERLAENKAKLYDLTGDE